MVGAAVDAVDYLVNNDGDFSWVELVKKAGAGAAAGATAGFILGITKGAGIKAASYASAAVYSATSEIIDYATGTKELSLQNVWNSILKVAGDTAVNGTFNYITNYAAAKFIPTNAGWFFPKKFVSYFTKTFGQRMIGQTLFAGSVANVITILWSEIKQLG
ncbi:MAG: hypothetical protein ACI4MQ_07665 [Candidatus Coproplasma sp.]